MVSANPRDSVTIPEKLLTVQQALLDELPVHFDEGWESVCWRVSQRTGVGVTLVESIHGDGRPHGNTRFGRALVNHFIMIHGGVDWRVIAKIGDLGISGAPTPAQSEGQTLSVPSRQTTEPAPRKGNGQPSASGSQGRVSGPVPPLFNEAFLIREFDRRERERGPIFAGFIVNDLLPRMGFEATDAKRILRAMEAQDMVRTEQRQNPNNLQYTTSFVTLNRNHPHVSRVLRGAAGIERTFPIGKIEGEPLSETIIRERM